MADRSDPDATKRIAADVRRDPPRHGASLKDRIAALRDRDSRGARRLELAVATVVLGQMLPTDLDVAVKGGGGLRLRFGVATRATIDMDLTVPNDVTADRSKAVLDDAFTRGWGPFTAVLGEADDFRPDHVRDEYVIRRYRAALSYGRDIKPWTTIAVEVGRDEVGGVQGATLLLDDGFTGLFRSLGLPDPQPVRVFPVDFQVAQKLHACTDLTRPNERAHDLVDLQVLLADTPRRERRALLLPAIDDTFRYRRTAWPVTVIRQDGWETIYTAAIEGVDGVLTDLGAAIDWTNELIADIGAPD